MCCEIESLYSFIIKLLTILKRVSITYVCKLLCSQVQCMYFSMYQLCSILTFLFSPVYDHDDISNAALKFKTVLH